MTHRTTLITSLLLTLLLLAPLTAWAVVSAPSLEVLPAGDNNIGNVDVVTLPALAAGTANIGDVDVLNRCDLAQTATGTDGAGVTLTLAAVVSEFHYICLIEITKFATALLVAAATPVLVTTTNLNNTPTISMSAAATAQGEVEERIFAPTDPIRSSTVNTATTIVGPATTSIIWRLNVYYYTAP